MPRSLSDEVRARVTKDLRATLGTPEGSIRKVAERQGVSPTAVRKIRDEAGEGLLEEARAQAKDAAEQQVRSNAQRRAALATRLLDTVESMVADLSAGSVVHSSYEGTITEAKLKGVLARDLQARAVALGIILDKHKMLEQWEHGERAVDAVSSWLQGMTAGTAGTFEYGTDDDLPAADG